MLDPDYDVVAYDPSDDTVVPAEAVLDIGRRCGVAPAGGFRDGLDLGCGTGKGLLTLRAALPGRIVGVDASKSACATARERVPDAEVICADLTNVEAKALGQFDLIFCVAVLYVLPPEARARALALIRDCLRPGGLALVAYYAGPMHAARAVFQRWVQSQIPIGLEPGDAIALARALIAERGRDAMRMTEPFRSRLRYICDRLASANDVSIFHEVLNPHFAPVDTATLAAPPLQFLDDLAAPMPSAAQGEERALLAALGEAVGGSYRRAVLTRTP